MRLDRKYYIQPGSIKITEKSGLAVAYIYTSVKGKPAAVAFIGKSNKPYLRCYWSKPEQREAAISQLFANVKANNDRKVAEKRAKRESGVLGTREGFIRRYSLTETAQLVRAALKTAYPATKFSVRSDSYSGGSSISVRWTDGPLSKDVNPILQAFAGATFDSSQDLKSYKSHSELNGEACTFGTDYVQGQRDVSEYVLSRANVRVHRETGLPLLEVVSTESGHAHIKGGQTQVDFGYFPDEDVISHGKSQRVAGGEWHQQLVSQIAYNTRTEVKAKEPMLPRLVTKELIDETVASLVN